MTNEEEEKRIEQTSMAIENIKQQEEELEGRASQLIAHSGYIIEQVKAAHQFSRRVTGRDLRIYLLDYLQKKSSGYTFREISSEKDCYDIKLPSRTAAKLEVFIRQKQLYGQSKLGSGEMMRCRIVNKVRKVGEQMEQISHFHPLVRFISHELSRDNEAFYPLVAARLQDHHARKPTGMYLFAVHKWQFSGLRTEEELRARVISFKNGEVTGEEDSTEFVSRCRLEGEDWISSGSVLEPLAEQIQTNLLECEDILQDDFREAAIEKESENSDLIDFQINSVQRHMERQVHRIEEVIERLEAQNKLRTIPAHRGKIQKLRERFEVQNEGLRIKKENFKRSFEGVVMGVVEVYRA